MSYEQRIADSETAKATQELADLDRAAKRDEVYSRLKRRAVNFPSLLSDWVTECNRLIARSATQEEIDEATTLRNVMANRVRAELP